MFAACSVGVATVWDSLLRYRAYGVVTGKVINISAPIDGVLRYVHVREGDEVRQNARLATVADLDYEHRLSRVADELRVAETTLHAEIAKIQWQVRVDETEVTKSMADFFEGTGDYHQASGELDIIRNDLARTRSLMESRAARESDLLNQTIQEQAQSEKLASIQHALKVLKSRAETAANIPRLGPEQVAPLIAKVEQLLHEAERIQEWIAQGELRAPVNGTVLRRHHPAGECIQSREPLFSVLEESSLEIELYVPQDMSDRYYVGDTIELKIEPFEKLVPCEVTFVGGDLREPPECIEIFYRSHVTLLPIRVRPAPEFAADRRMAIGAVAKLPHFAQPKPGSSEAERTEVATNRFFGLF